MTRFRIRNYRNCRDSVFSPNAKLSTLIGVNGAGKTTLLHGIQLLHKVATNTSHYPKYNTATHKCSIESSFRFTSKKPVVLHHKANVSFSLDDRNQDEISFVENFWKLEGDENFKDWIGVPPFFGALLTSPNNSEILEDWLTPKGSTTSGTQVRWRFSEEVEEVAARSLGGIAPYARRVIELLTNIRYYGATQFTNPELCPASIEIEDERVRSRGFIAAAHPRFLHDLYLASKRNDRPYKQFKSIVGPETLGLVHDISFEDFDLPTSQYEVKSGGRILKKDSHRQIVIPFFRFGSIKLSPNQLSEGTLKTIALIFYLSTDSSNILLVEEPEVGIHHGLLRSIVEIIKDFSTEKQIIITTHSDFILDSLNPSDVFLVESQAKGGVKVQNLPEKLSAQNFSALRDFLRNSGGLGEYIRSGGISDAI